MTDRYWLRLRFWWQDTRRHIHFGPYTRLRSEVSAVLFDYDVDPRVASAVLALIQPEGAKA